MALPLLLRLPFPWYVCEIVISSDRNLVLFCDCVIVLSCFRKIAVFCYLTIAISLLHPMGRIRLGVRND